MRRLVAILPPFWQNELKRIRYRRQIRQERFVTSEPEYEMLSTLISPGDWVIDVGANIGHYTKRLSQLVGESGRVIAFEPVPETFALLSANTQLFQFPNVTLINAAVSDKTKVAGMAIPSFESGLKNLYQATLSNIQMNTTKLRVLTFSLDSLSIPRKIALVKIDAEGHESFVLKGMKNMLHRDHPTLIVETSSSDVQASLHKLGYVSQQLSGSPNILFQYNGHDENAL